jgi:hypothetical protein
MVFTHKDMVPRFVWLLIPVSFIGGCSLSLKPMWTVMEVAWVRPVPRDQVRLCPVLVYSEETGYGTAPLGSIPPGSAVVTGNFDDPRINRELNHSIGRTDEHPYFRMVERRGLSNHVALEVPTMKDRKRVVWYEVAGDRVVPRRQLLYGPGFAWFVLAGGVGVGVAAGFLTRSMLRRCAREKCLSDRKSP